LAQQHNYNEDDMTDSELIESTKIRMIACECSIRNLTGSAASVTPIPGTDRVIATGTREEIARLVGTPPAPQLSVQEVRTDVERWAASHAGASAVPTEPVSWEWRHKLKGGKGWGAWGKISKGRYDRRADYANSEFRELFLATPSTAAVRAAFKQAIEICDEVIRDAGTPEESAGAVRCRDAIRALINTPAADGGNGGDAACPLGDDEDLDGDAAVFAHNGL
jgi:hypothetical protein